MKNRLCNRRSALRGAAALEFALVFPVLFLMLYGMLSYSLIFAAQHTLSDSAAEAARIALRFTGDQKIDSNAESRGDIGCNAVADRVKWIEKIINLNLKCNVEVGRDANNEIIPCEGGECISIYFNYEYGKNPLVPKLFILPVPERITGQAIAQISLKY